MYYLYADFVSQKVFAFAYQFVQVGITEIAVRHKILNAVANVHKRQWDMPERSRISGKQLR